MGIGFKESSNVVLEENALLYCAKGIYLDVSPYEPDTVNTLPGDTFDAFKDEGAARNVLGTGFDAQLGEARDQIAQLEAAGISLKEATDHLLADGVKKFVDPFDSLLATIERRRDEIAAG